LEAILAAIRGQPDESRLVLAIAGRIRETRKSMRLTQENFAERAKLSSLQVSKVERAEVTTTLDIIDLFANGLEVAGEYLIEGLTGEQLERRLCAVEISYAKYFR
jgi:transcriptional regulator with XRE-family HTH domain